MRLNSHTQQLQVGFLASETKQNFFIIIMTGANLVHRMYRGSKGVAVPSLNHIFNKLSIKSLVAKASLEITKVCQGNYDNDSIV